MNSLRVFSVLALSYGVHAFADTGNFKITSSNFKDLYNANGGAGVVTPTPWAGSYWAYGNNGISDRENRAKSPSEKYDEWARQGNKATKWEEENHSCKNVDKDFVKGCGEWWGHCNAWSAAAVTHEEPRAAKTVDGIEFGVADQKAYLTEIWMSSGALFAGDTNKSVKTGKWACDPDSKTAKETDAYGTSNYQKFWDLSPRDVFLILTNYVGLRNSGVVIDRFTGDEVWNQPVVGYRFFPVTETGEEPGSKLHYARIEMMIYWAHDGVEGDFLSAMPFDIKTIDKDIGSKPGYGKSYESRKLSFKLFFNAPVVVEDGQIKSAGKIVGEGIWKNQEKCPSVAELDQGHPDFIWRPTALGNYGDVNPYIKADKVMAIIDAKGGSGGSGGSGGENEGSAKKDYKVTFSLDYFSGRTDLAVRRYIKKIFRREGVATILHREMGRNGRRVFTTISFPGGITEARITSILTDLGAVSIEVSAAG